MSDTLVVNEIYLSLQGESTLAGLPCIFVRLTACDLRCSYCDTAYAFAEGTRKSLADIDAEVRRLAEPFKGVRSAGCGVRNGGGASAGEGYRLPLVELTGGEPLLQKGSLPLMQMLCDEGFTVLLETSGGHDIAPVDPRVRRIMDLKCPGSGEAGRNRWVPPQGHGRDQVRHLHAGGLRMGQSAHRGAQAGSDLPTAILLGASARAWPAGQVPEEAAVGPDADLAPGTGREDHCRCLAGAVSGPVAQGDLGARATGGLAADDYPPNASSAARL